MRHGRQKVGAGRRPRKRTAGPHMLPSNSTDTAAAIVLPAGESVEEGVADEAAEAELDQAGSQPDLVSSRTRGSKRPAEVQREEGTATESDDSEGEMPVDQAPASNDDTSSDDSDTPNINNTRAAAQRRNVARVLFEDRAVEVPPRPRESDDEHCHVLELSVTLSKTKGHVHPAWLSMVAQWMQMRCVSGACALERGGRQQHLHLQIILRMRMDPADLESLKNELKALVGWRRGDGSGTYCSVKQFGVGQVCQLSNAHAHTCLSFQFSRLRFFCFTELDDDARLFAQGLLPAALPHRPP